MENITLGATAEVIIFLSTMIGSITVICKLIMTKFEKGVKTIITDELKPIVSSVDKIIEEQKDIKANVDTAILDSIKNYLSKCFNDLRQGQVLSEANRQRVYEQMEEYISRGGNSYIHKEFEDLKKEGLL